MGLKCCVSGCANIYKRKYRKLEKDKNCPFFSFHRFPTNLEIQTAWISNVRQINGSNWQPVNTSFVCSEHFDRFSWEKNREDGKRKLKFQAIPTIFNNLSQKFQNDHNYSRTSIKDIDWIFIGKNELRSSVQDHTYAKIVSSDENLGNDVLSPTFIEKTSITTSTEITEKNIPNISQSSFTDNENFNIVLNYSDILTNSCTIALQNNTLNILSEVEQAENAINAQTQMQNIAVKKENEQLKTELAKLKKIADKIFRQNEILRKSNKKLRRQNEILTNLQMKTKENISKILNKDQMEAIGRKNSHGLRWEPKTLEQALTLKLKCGLSEYRQLKKQIPLPSIRTIQRKMKHIELRSKILQETFDLLEKRQLEL